MKRILTIALSVVLLISMLTVDAGAYAVDLIYEKDSEKKVTDIIDYEETVQQYLTLEFKTPEDKLATMVLYYEKGDYQLWVDELTGEVATKDLKSGQILFSNPYDVGAEYKKSGTGPSASTKKKIMSQVMIKYDDNGTDKTMYSFEEAAMRGQIKIKNIKNGIRVEYSIGREESRMLVPKVILKESFETKILDVFAKEVNEISKEAGLPELEWRDYQAVSKRSYASIDSGNSLWFNFMQLLAYYQYKSKDTCTTEREKISLYAAYPICKTANVYVFATDATQTETIKIENYIKTYCASYTFEQLEIDHAATNYESNDKNPALFKLSLEYTLDDWGMSVRLPANGLRFNESLYKLTYLSVLPYMGTGSNYLLGDTTETFTGYNFFPDGSGTIFRHEELAGTSTTTINAKVYGFDYAYNTITGSHTEVVRYPVFGIVSNYHDTRTATEKQLVSEEVKDPQTGEIIAEAEYEEVEVPYTYTEDRGFVAIIEEGDALAELSTYHEGALSKYNSINMLFYPRPKDSYNLKNAISVGANATWTVVSSRKYVGNYKIRYIMLTDEKLAEENKIDEYYEASWMGMAEAYRDYLYATGELSALTENDVEEDIPVYIETFGGTETLEKILSIPVNVMTPLTSFENVKTMYDELSAEGLKNIKFKLTGYANGGLFSSAAYNLKWEKNLGGSKGFEALVDYADEKGFQVFPDFDFAYVRAGQNTLFDGLTLKKHVVKSINNTYMSRRYYSATRQTMIGRYELAVSAAYYAHFYEKLTENLLKYYEGNTSTISVASLGSALNSDFDEDEPYNREDSKKSTIKALDAISRSFDDVMTENGNAYTWKYVDYILNVPLDSSRYMKSSAAVPFIGVVLHGSKQFSGSALNMEGNIGYSLLKAIENGAGVYFILCYQNYAVLKKSKVLSEYYSVRYDILKDDVIRYYNLVNDLTKDLQTTLITSHEFLIGERVPDADEIIADEKEIADKLAAELEAAKTAEEKARITSLLNGRVTAQSATETALEWVNDYYTQALALDKGYVEMDESGRITVTVGMQTLVDRVIALTDEKTKNDEEKEKALTEKNYREAALAVWKEVYDPFNSVMTTGKLGTYSTLLETLTKANATIAKTEDTLAVRKDAVDTALSSAIADAFTEILTKYAAYKAADEASKADAKAAVEKVAGTMEVAEKLQSLNDAVTAAQSAIDALAIGYSQTAEYAQLYTVRAEAEAAYTKAQEADAKTVEKYNDIASGKVSATDAEMQKAKAYVNAVKAVEAAEEALKDRVTALTNAIGNCDKELVNFNETNNEYKLIVELKASCEKELAELEDVTNKVTAYRKAVVEAQNVVDGLLTTSGKARAAFAAADEKLQAYANNYTKSYKSKNEYTVAVSQLENAEKALESYKESIKAQLPVVVAYEELVKIGETRVQKTEEKNELEYSYLNTAKYKELKGAVDTATANANAILDDLKANMEKNETYQKLLKDYEEAKAEYEKYTLAYTETEDYQEAKLALDEAQAAVDKLLLGYESESEYKTLKAAADKADSEYEAAAKTVLAAVKDTELGQLTDSAVKTLKSKVEAKGKADAELNSYVDAYTAAVKESDVYKIALRTLNTANTEVTTCIRTFQNDLEAQATASKKSDEPLTTVGGKYAAAKTAFTDAEAMYMYFTGEKTVPSTLKNVDVYSTLIKEDKNYKAALEKQTAAESALKTYTQSFANNVKASNEATIAAITDAEAKAANTKYLAANAEYNTANTAWSTQAATLRSFNSALYTAVNNYFTTCNTLASNKLTVLTAQANVNVSSLKADYDKANETFAKISDNYTDASEISTKATETFVLANAAAGSSQSNLTAAIRNIKTQITKVKNVMDRIANYVTRARTNLADSNLALELMGENKEYDETLRKELKASNAAVKELESKIHELSNKAVAASNEAIEVASKIYATDLVITDPYAAVVEEEEKEEKTEDEDAYVYTKYTDDSGNIVKVGYESGVYFILNYNYFAVTVTYAEKDYTIPAYGGIRVEVDGSSAVFTAALDAE